MATQSLEFGYTTGQTLTAKLFAVGSDTVVATAGSVNEAANREGRYVAAFTDVPAGEYLLVYFLSGIGAGSERYVLTLTTATFQPVSELGGGASAEDIVDELLDRGVTAIPVQQGVTSSGTIELVQGDTYNGIGKPLLSFPTSSNYTDGWSATLTIRDKDDAVIATASGVVAGATQITVSLTAPTGLAMEGCPGVWQGKFDVQVSKDASRATVAKGIAYVYEDQTRT